MRHWGKLMRELIEARRRGVTVRASLVLATVLGALSGVLWASWTNSPGYDESGHLAAGIYHWRTGSFAPYHVNPPLPRALQTGVVATASFELPAKGPIYAPASRFEWTLAPELFRQRGRETFRLLAWARFANLVPLFVVAWLAATWSGGLRGGTLRGPRLVPAEEHRAADLSGRTTPAAERPATTVALTAWCVVLLDPTNLAAATLVTPDIWASASGLLATYAVWRYAKAPDAATAWAAGLGMGLAVACKFTWIPLIPVWGAYCLWGGWPGRRWRVVGDAALATLAAWLLVCLTYGFEGVGRPLNSFLFGSKAFTADWVRAVQGSWAGRLPVPLPEWMVRGLDVQKADFDSGHFTSYFAGEHTPTGDPRFYVATFLHKWPLPWLVVWVFGMAASIRRLRGADSIAWVMPLALLGMVSAFTGFTHHYRYVGPMTVFFAVCVAQLMADRHRWVRIGAVVLLCLGAVDVARQAPHFLKYDNGLSALSGGKGWLFGGSMFGSTVDWGQDLLRLRKWLDEHPEVELTGLQHNSMANVVEALSLPERFPPERLSAACVRPFPDSRGCRQAGWYALNRKGLHDAHARYQDYRLLEPYAVVGGTIFIYRVPPLPEE